MVVKMLVSATKDVIIRMFIPDNHGVELKVVRCIRIGFKAAPKRTSEHNKFKILRIGIRIISRRSSLLVTDMLWSFSALQSQE